MCFEFVGLDKSLFFCAALCYTEGATVPNTKYRQATDQQCPGHYVALVLHDQVII